MKKNLLLSAAILFNIMVVFSTTTVLRVNSGSTLTEDGLSWESGFKTITAAITAAGQPTSPNIVEIWVKSGTYSEAPFYMQTNVNVYGGFAGIETERDQRNSRINVTTLTPSASAKRIIIRHSATSVKTAVWDGFTLTGASGNTGSGGAAYLNNGNTLRNCIITGNNASATGTAHGGGVYLDNGATIENCIITNNTAKNGGGGLAGGSNNTLPSIKVINCIITNNIANGASGGGVFIGNYNADIYNTLIANNTTLATAGTGGFVMGSSTGVVSANMINCTVVNNLGGDTGFGGVNMFTATAGGMKITNCIIAGNRTATDPQTTNNININDPANVIISYNGIEELPVDFEGNNNFDLTSNQFKNPTPAAGQQATLPAYDWSLLAGSICRNAGNNAVVYGNADLEGNARIIQNVVDLGAYESSISTTIPQTGSNNLYFSINDNKLYINGNMDIISIYDLKGYEVYRTNAVTTSIDLSALNHGLYVVVGKKNNETLKYKFVK
ncbi:MAG: choice-of-anchor Q domain-containing protein [Paludibacter sp.]|nr:choice-of-anchor Q domain-containing protein [Paludibacter sp.]